MTRFSPIPFAGWAAATLLALACASPTPPHGEVTILADAPAAAPSSKFPGLTLALAWDGSPLTLPPPIDADRVVFNTPQYRQWQYRGTGGKFTLLDPSGACHQVQMIDKSNASKSVKTVRETPALQTAQPKGKKKKVKEEPVASHGVKLIVARYRPDGTLDTVTTYRADGALDGWIVYAPDGQSRQVRVQMRATAECPPGVGLIHSVYYYEPERIRQLLVNVGNVVWREAVVTETGAVRTRLNEDARKADAVRKLGPAPKKKK